MDPNVSGKVRRNSRKQGIITASSSELSHEEAHRETLTMMEIGYSDGEQRRQMLRERELERLQTLRRDGPKA